MLTKTLQSIRTKEKDEAFSLVELMVVVLIIAILLAVAIPTFLGARSKAQDRSSQSSLRNALTAAKTMSADTGAYTGADSTAVTGLISVEPSLTYVATASTGPKIVSVLASATVWSGAALSDSGRCYWITDTVSGGTRFGSTSTAGNCTGTSAAGAAAAGW